MRLLLKRVNAGLGMCVLGAVFAAQAYASCSDFGRKVTPSSWHEEQPGQVQARLIPAGYQLASGGGIENNSIVGLWKFKFTADGNLPPGPPDGATIDAGYVTWHGDGTELMNSGRSPTTGDFCMGVWERVGNATYRLSHIGLSWAFNPDVQATGPGTGGAVFIGPANIREEVTLDPSGDSYHGTFELIQYATDEKTVLADIKGLVTATRITVDSGI